MALTIVEKSRGSMGGKAFRCFEVTTDTSTAGSITITAASCGMNYFDHVMVQGATMTSADIGDFFLSTTTGLYADMNVTSLDSGDQFELWAIGS